jgi:hypothetical protein
MGSLTSPLQNDLTVPVSSPLLHNHKTLATTTSIRRTPARFPPRAEIDGNDMEDNLSQALEYQNSLRCELVFHSTQD